MPPPEPHHPEPRASRPTAPGQSGRDSGRRGPGSSSARQRPSPTSSLSPSPSPLMSVPDPTEAAAGASSAEGSSGAWSSGTARAGRRQHHRAPGAQGGAATEELVYLSGRVPRALRDELHIRAINEGRPVVDLLRDAIRGYLDRGAEAQR
jgi:hypothetical protein